MSWSRGQPNTIVEKRMLSAFFGTDLDFTLRQRGIKTLVVTGVPLGLRFEDGLRCGGDGL